MGTSDFALPTLNSLIKNANFDLVAIYTKKPVEYGRKRNQKSKIFQIAQENNVPVFTPFSLKDLDMQKQFIDLQADIVVVVSYGLLLPPEILEGTKFGCINIHPSLLPKWRGASPIERTIENGDIETGVSIIQMNEALDAGDILFQNKFSLDSNASAIKLVEKMANMGAEIICDLLPKINAGEVRAILQDETQKTYAKKILKSELEINWQEDALLIVRKIKAFNIIYLFVNFNNNRKKIRSC